MQALTVAWPDSFVSRKGFADLASTIPHSETSTDMAEGKLPPLPELSPGSALLAPACGDSWRESPQEHFWSREGAPSLPTWHRWVQVRVPANREQGIK
jgi:hypothetical protein